MPRTLPVGAIKMTRHLQGGRTLLPVAGVNRCPDRSQNATLIVMLDLPSSLIFPLSVARGQY